MEWFREWFGEDYLCVYAHRGDEEARLAVPFLQKLVGSPPRRILDLGCGTGRHALPLSRAGFSVVGLDLSEPLLEEAIRSCGGNGGTPCFVVADMRAIPFRSCFDAALSLFTSFGYFDDPGNLACLREVSACLAPGGIFVLDYLNHLLARRSLGTTERPCARDGVVRETRRVDGSGRRIEKTIELRHGERVRTYRESVSLYSLSELAEMLESAGFSGVSRYGHLDGRPYREDSPRLVVTARRGS